MLRRSLSQTTAVRMRPSTVATATTLMAAACVLSYPVAAVAATVAVAVAVARASALVRVARHVAGYVWFCAVCFLIGWRASRSVCVSVTPRSLPALRRVRRCRLPCHRDWASALCFVARPEESHARRWRYRLCEHMAPASWSTAPPRTCATPSAHWTDPSSAPPVIGLSAASAKTTAVMVAVAAVPGLTAGGAVAARHAAAADPGLLPPPARSRARALARRLPGPSLAHAHRLRSPSLACAR